MCVNTLVFLCALADGCDKCETDAVWVYGILFRGSGFKC